ncbi:MAG: DegT/DnrJ/EryC1/StrS family aminotransferase [Anaerolineae bacterium]
MLTIPGGRLAQQQANLRPALDAAVQRVVDRAVYTPDVEVAHFEAEFAQYIGVRHAIAVASGGAAVMLALRAVGVGAGGEVISVPNVDISASAPIAHAGGRPVWVDIHPRTYNLDPTQLEAAITPRTRAIVVVHMYGSPAAMRPILTIAERYRLAVIEDASLAHGAMYGGQRVGSLGRIGCFSFSPGKLLGALGEAGIVVTNDAALAERVRVLGAYGFNVASLNAVRRGVIGARFEYEAEGFNAGMDELQAAVLRVKLPHLDGWLAQRRAHAALYRERLAALEPEYLLLPEDDLEGEAVYRNFVIRTPRRDALQAYLAGRGIWSGLMYVPPLHVQPVYHGLGYAHGAFPVTEQVTRELLCLPTYPELTRPEIERIVDTIEHFFRTAPGGRKHVD